MGHACSILDFKCDMGKEAIQEACYDWQRRNADLEECGYNGPRFKVRWTDKRFESLEKAHTYLESTFGDYNQM